MVTVFQKAEIIAVIYDSKQKRKIWAVLLKDIMGFQGDKIMCPFLQWRDYCPSMRGFLQYHVFCLSGWYFSCAVPLFLNTISILVRASLVYGSVAFVPVTAAQQQGRVLICHRETGKDFRLYLWVIIQTKTKEEAVLPQTGKKNPSYKIPEFHQRAFSIWATLPCVLTWHAFILRGEPGSFGGKYIPSSPHKREEGEGWVFMDCSLGKKWKVYSE